MHLATPPYHCRPKAFHAFRESLVDLSSTRGLLQAACAIAAHDLKSDQFEEADEACERLAQTVRNRIQTTSTPALLAHLHDVLFDVAGFRGNEGDYYHPHNSLIPMVLRNKVGIPISLTLIYKIIAERVGLTVHGINAPGHFLAGVEEPGTESAVTLVDPFGKGRILSRGEAIAVSSLACGWPMEDATATFPRATNAQWLARMLNNLIAVFAHGGRERDALAMQELYGELAAYLES